MTEVLRPSVVVMGVSGSGKSTIGALVAELLHVQFMDGDDLHPLANVRKMAAGDPLNDSDRWPWLAKVGVALAERKTTGVVVACSAFWQGRAKSRLREQAKFPAVVRQEVVVIHESAC